MTINLPTPPYLFVFPDNPSSRQPLTCHYNRWVCIFENLYDWSLKVFSTFPQVSSCGTYFGIHQWCLYEQFIFISLRSVSCRNDAIYLFIPVNGYLFPGSAAASKNAAEIGFSSSYWQGPLCCVNPGVSVWVNVGPLRDPRLSSKMILPLVFPLAVYESSISLVSLLGVGTVSLFKCEPSWYMRSSISPWYRCVSLMLHDVEQSSRAQNTRYGRRLVMESRSRIYTVANSNRQKAEHFIKWTIKANKWSVVHMVRSLADLPNTCLRLNFPSWLEPICSK